MFNKQMLINNYFFISGHSIVTGLWCIIFVCYLCKINIFNGYFSFFVLIYVNERKHLNLKFINGEEYLIASKRMGDKF